MRMADNKATAPIVRLIMKLYDLPREIALIILGFMPVRRRFITQIRPRTDPWAEPHPIWCEPMTLPSQNRGNFGWNEELERCLWGYLQ